MQHNYCTVYSKEYVYMGVILYNSLLRYDKDFCLYIFFMDDESLEIMRSLNLDHAVLISLKDVEAEDLELAAVKSSRTDKEYSWTIKGSVLLYLFEHVEDMENIIWLDGDLKFYSDPQPIFDEFESCSILLTEEKYTGPYEYLSKIYGVYQLGFIGFKREENVLECLRWYRERLLEWCHEAPDEGKWSDQRYAVDWPSTYKNVGVVQNIGINLTPFILYRYRQENKYLLSKVDDEIYVDETRLVFFHFYGFKYFDGNEFDLCRHWMKFSDDTLRILYLDYIDSVNKAIEDIRKTFPQYYMDAGREGKYVSNYFNLELTQNDKLFFYYTIADKKSIPSLIAMNGSISRYMDNYRLWVCCVDEQAYNDLINAGLKNVIPMESRNVENSDIKFIKDLQDSERYILLLKAAMANFIIKNNYAVKKLMYLDPSIYFFSNPSVIFDAWKDGCIFIHNHNGTSKKQKPSVILGSGVLGFVRKPGTIYFIEDYIKVCTQSQKENGKYICPEMPLADYYEIMQIKNLAVDINNSQLRFVKLDKKHNKILYFENELICFNFGKSRDIRFISRIMEKSKQYQAGAQIMKQIYMPYLSSIIDTIHDFN